MGKRYVVRLTEEERTDLLALVRKGKRKIAARKRIHAQVLLKADEGDHGPSWVDERIAEAFDVHRTTIASMRQRFVEEGLESALNRRKHPPRPEKKILDGEKEARLIAIACGPPPEGRARWTLALLADQLVRLEIVETVSYETIRRTLKKTS
jgi:transposase